MTEEKFITLVEERRGGLLRLAASFLHDEAQAEDVVQETLLRLWLLRGRLPDGGDDFHALSVRITKNVCISLWRQQQQRKEVALEAIGQLEATAKHPGGTSQQRMEEQEGEAQLQEAIQKLSPTERRIFLLWKQDIGIQQIAAITGSQPRTISSTLSLAKRKLLEQIKRSRK